MTDIIQIYKSKEIFTKSTYTPDNNIQKITISDITGKNVLEKTNIKQTGTIDLSGLKRGLYLINIQSEKNAHKKNSKGIKKTLRFEAYVVEKE